MFARAAVVGRVARERSEARRHFQQQKQELKRKTPQAPLRQRCFIPLVRGPCLTVALGFFLILIGAIMCNFAFHAGELSIVWKDTGNQNRTSTEVERNDITFRALKSLTYIGPSLMGLGIFIIIIACVLLLDQRDKILKKYIDSIVRNQQELSMELSLHAVATTGMCKPPEQKRERGSSAYFELNESKVGGPLTKAACAVSLSSAPGLQTFRAEMEDIEELPHDIELVTLNECKSTDSEDECDTRVSSSVKPESDPESQCMLVKKADV